MERQKSSRRFFVNALSLENTIEKSDVPDPFRMYLHEISKHPLLTKDQEREVTESISRFKDSKAEQRLVVSNLRLVVKIAMDYYSSHLNILDLIQEGNVGLIRAVRKFDPEKGTRFSTYASFWIRAYILKYLMDSWSMVKVGTKDSQRKLFYSLNKEKERIQREGIVPTLEMLADNFEVSVEDVQEMETRLARGDVSLEQPLYGEGEDTFLDTLSSDQDIEETVAEREESDMIHRKILEFKKMLNEKERYILDHRIIAEEPITLREIGERFNTSRESIRQLQGKISKKLTRNLRAVAAYG
jgi:RNA polymerase sigma-32 factor